MKNFVIKNPDELRRFLINIVVFTSPALAVFFFQLSQGVELAKAWPLALLILWGLLADYFKKLKA